MLGPHLPHHLARRNLRNEIYSYSAQHHNQLMSDLVYAAQHDSVNHSMSKNYVPQLKLMREMAIRHGHKEDTFNAKFIKSLELVISLRRTSNGVEESFDVMQYFAEKMTWEHFRKYLTISYILMSMLMNTLQASLARSLASTQLPQSTILLSTSSDTALHTTR